MTVTPEKVSKGAVQCDMIEAEIRQESSKLLYELERTSNSYLL